MPHLINVRELSLPAAIHYSVSSDVCHELTKRFEFDQIVSLSGEFQLAAEKDFFVLRGTYKGEVVLNGSRVVVEEPIELFLLASQAQDTAFDITEDFEILDENFSFDLEELLGQYLYLEICDFE